MSFAKSKTEQYRTSRWLFYRFMILLAVITIFFAAIADYFLYQSLLEKDRSLIDARLTTYQRIFEHSGLQKLKEVIRDEDNDEQVWLIELESAKTGVENLLDNDHAGSLRLTDPFWPVIDTREQRWFMDKQSLDGTNHIIVGMSSLPRQQQLVQYRLAMTAVLIPILLFSALLFRKIYEHTLLPIRDLLTATSQIQATQNLSERVRVRDPNTELGQLAMLTNDLLATIEKLLTGMRGALDNVAHDMRTPMARQKLQLEALLVRSDVQRQGDLAEQLGILSEESEYISSMLATLMDISEAESGIIQLDKQHVNLHTELTKLLEIYRFLAEENNIDIHLECSPDITLFADPTRIKRAVGNLLDNAVKFSPANTEIWVVATTKNKRLNLVITDQGEGIHQNDLAHLFDRLYRGDRARNTQGMGLGLSLVKAIVQAHGGEVLAGNRQDEKGASFVINMPL